MDRVLYFLFQGIKVFFFVGLASWGFVVLFSWFSILKGEFSSRDETGDEFSSVRRQHG